MKDLPDYHDVGHLYAALELFAGRDTAVDIGAHRGIWTRELLAVFDRVIAFEPTELYRQIDTRAEIHPAALSDVDGKGRMQAGTENNGQSYLMDGDDVHVRTLDGYSFCGIDFIKIDVEGLEYQVLSGGIETLKREIPAVMIEENGLCERYGHRWGDACGLLESIGYRHAGQWNKDHLYL